MHSLKLTSFVLFVSDVARSRDFYVTVLGQEVAMDIGNINVGFKSGLAIWERKYATNTIFGSEAAPGGDRSDSEVYFETDDIDAAFKKASAAGVELVHPVRVQPWQQRVFRLYDPDGFVVEIGESMDVTVKRLAAEGLSPDAIAAKTFMPIEAVRAML
ncbi:MAG TPA: VOC family protein [Treponemataceae bacterium]|mgnify:CR=1 FL=1|nr:VOC family protein [Treponemataceae bacterium]HPS45336.1 VOC family protein [Treponemataceae bacterium]